MTGTNCTNHAGFTLRFIDLPAVAYGKRQDNQFIIFYHADQTVISDAIVPVLPLRLGHAPGVRGRLPRSVASTIRLSRRLFVDTTEQRAASIYCSTIKK